MSGKILSPLAAFLSVLAITSLASAQVGVSGGSNPGLFGNRTSGSSFGTSSLGGGGSLSRGGGIGLGSGFGGGFGGNQRLTRSNQAQGFVGRDAESVRQFVDVMTGNRENGQADRRGRDRGFRRNRSGGRRDSQDFNRNASDDSFGPRRGDGGRRRPEIRRQLRVAFPRPLTRNPQLAANLTGRIKRLRPAQASFSPTAVIENRTAILRGVVATVQDRRLAEKLASLEPGIDRVLNELSVAEPVVTPAPDPTD